MTKKSKLFGILGLAVLTVLVGGGLAVPTASAACTPGTGVVCPADLQPVLDAGLASIIDTVVSFGTFIIKPMIVFAIFVGLYLWFKRKSHKGLKA